MTAETIPFSLAELEAFFFDMAKETYAASKTPQTFGVGHKGYLLSSATGLEYSDQWWSKPDGFSKGETRIVYEGELLWLMTYQGFMADESEVGKLLRQALRFTYLRRVFCGGRGPAEFPRGLSYGPSKLQYHNNVHVDDGFAGFSGMDEIIQLGTAKRLYWHFSHGGLMVPRESLKG